MIKCYASKKEKPGLVYAMQAMAHKTSPINTSSCVSGVRGITRQDVGVGCESSSGERTGGKSIGIGRLFSSNEGGREASGDGGNGGSVENRLRDVGQDPIRDEGG